MPLIKGKSHGAFMHNLKAEMAAGKPMKQSLAIAYAQKRRANKMSGGMIEDHQDQIEKESGFVDPDLGQVEDNSHSVDSDIDMVGRIIKQREEHYSEGGKVANGGDDDYEEMADSRPNNFDDLALRDDLESTNSGAADGDFLGDEAEDKDRADIVARIMRSRAKKDRMPRPS